MLVHLILSQRSLRLFSVLFILFTLFSSSAVIFTISSYSSLIYSSASDILLFILSRVFLISVIVLFVCVCLVFSSSRSLLIGRWILNHWNTREVPFHAFFMYGKRQEPELTEVHVIYISIWIWYALAKVWTYWSLYDMHMAHIHMIHILTTSGHHPVFSCLNSPWGILFWGQLQWMMAFWLQHPLFTEIATEIFVSKEKLKRRLEVEMSFSVTQSCPTLFNPMEYLSPSRRVCHTNVNWVGDAIQPSHPLSPPSPPAFNPSQHQSLF